MTVKKVIAIIICAVMISTFAACGNNKAHDEIMAKRDALVGEYLDAVSQRAMLYASKDEKADDGLVIVVSWANSASETVRWTMHAVLGEKGEKLSYTDGICETLTYDSNGNETSEITDDRMDGYFDVSEGRLLWTGAADEQCRLCEFELLSEQHIPYEDPIPEQQTPHEEPKNVATYEFGNLKVRVSNVVDQWKQTYYEFVDDSDPLEYTVFLYEPGAQVWIENADMNPAEGYEDGQKHARWGFETIPDYDRLRITDEMTEQPFDVSSLLGLISLEASVYMLRFEPVDFPVPDDAPDYSGTELIYAGSANEAFHKSLPKVAIMVDDYFAGQCNLDTLEYVGYTYTFETMRACYAIDDKYVVIGGEQHANNAYFIYDKLDGSIPKSDVKDFREAALNVMYCLDDVQAYIKYNPYGFYAGHNAAVMFFGVTEYDINTCIKKMDDPAPDENGYYYTDGVDYLYDIYWHNNSDNSDTFIKTVATKNACTYRGVGFGLKEYALAAYPDAHTEKYPGGIPLLDDNTDYIWYARDPQKSGSVLVMIFEDDKLVELQSVYIEIG